jgi:hypothetical protein
MYEWKQRMTMKRMENYKAGGYSEASTVRKEDYGVKA